VSQDLLQVRLCSSFTEFQMGGNEKELGIYIITIFAREAIHLVREYFSVSGALNQKPVDLSQDPDVLIIAHSISPLLTKDYVNQCNITGSLVAANQYGPRISADLLTQADWHLVIDNAASWRGLKLIILDYFSRNGKDLDELICEHCRGFQHISD
jgi:hypothetical protein